MAPAAREDAAIDDTRIEDRSRSVIAGANTFLSPDDFVADLAAESWFQEEKDRAELKERFANATIEV